MPVEEPGPDECAGEVDEQQGEKEGHAGHGGSVARRYGPVKTAKGDDNPHGMTERYVYDFSEGSDLGPELLGGKGAGLAEMTAIGIPVPAGFTVTTAACIAYMTGEQIRMRLFDLAILWAIRVASASP